MKRLAPMAVLVGLSESTLHAAPPPPVTSMRCDPACLGSVISLGPINEGPAYRRSRSHQPWLTVDAPATSSRLYPVRRATSSPYPRMFAELVPSAHA
jgi:hypothetical protein